MYVPRHRLNNANLVSVSQTSRGPANRNRTRPLNRSASGREADRIKDPRQGWATPTAALKTRWRSGPLPVPAVGVAAGLWASIVGIVITVVLTLVVWIFAAGESASNTAMRVGADIWLAAHGTPFQVGGGVWTLMPWAWVVFPGVTLWAAGRWVAHRAAIAFVKSAAVAAASLAAAYSVVALLASLFGTLSGAGAMPMRAVIHTFVLAFVISGAAILHRARLGGDIAHRAWRMSRPAVAAAAVLLIGAAVVFIAAVVASFSSITASLTSVAPGLIGGIALFIAWLGYLPAALMWCLSYVTGAGIMVAGSAVTPLAGLPDRIDMVGLSMVASTSQPWWLVGLVIPIAAGVVLSRLAGPAPSPRLWVQQRLIALAVLLIMLDAWWFISVGRLGEGRLELLGPSPLVIPILMLTVLLGIAGDVGVSWLRRRWKQRGAQPVETVSIPDDEDVPATS